MADDRYDYYSNRSERDFGDRSRGRGRDRDTWLDNRSGVGASGPGYRADFNEGGRRGGSRDYGSQSSESRSFEPRDYGSGGGDRGYRAYGDSYSQGNYGGGFEHRDYGGTDDPYRDSYARGGSPSFSEEFGFGRDLRSGGSSSSSSYGGGYDRSPDRNAYSGRDRDDRRDFGGHDHRRGFWERAGDTVASWMGDDQARARHEQDMRESHSGKGPKGYKRSDSRIQEDVNDRLTDDHWLDASHIEVKVDGGEVTLSGHVASREDKRRAESVAELVSGVSHVQNNLRVDTSAVGSQQGSTSAAENSTTGSTSGGAMSSGTGSTSNSNSVLDEQAKGRH